MEEDLPFIYRFKDFIFNILGFVFFIIDLFLDVLAVVTFYQQEEYVAMGVLIFLLLGSSVLLHTFSWLWYKYEFEEMGGSGEYVYLEKYLKNRMLLGVLHVCQLAIIFRFAGVMEISLRNLRSASTKKEGTAVFLTHDLSFLRLIETFSENAPQLTLMLTIIVHSEHVELITGLKTLVSFVAIALSVVMYHYSMRAFNEKKAKMTLAPSLVYFFWNLLLITPRVAAVALCASILPAWVIVVHFILLWFPLFFWAWLQETDLMDNPAGEWFYRATVALIWYFSWFNVSEGNSMKRSIIYHLFIAVDITILLGLWWWHSCQDVFISGLTAMWVFISVGTCYIVGIVVKILYYKLCHPNRTVTEESRGPAPACMGEEELGTDEVLAPPPPPLPLTGAQKRMKRLAENFYS